MKLYTAQDIETLPWPDTEAGRYAKCFLLPLMTQGVNSYISNLRTQLYALDVGGVILPVTVNEGETNNCYVCSPYDHHISYALDTFKRMDRPFVSRPLHTLVSGIGYALRRGGLGRIVFLNNWLFSTSLIPDLTKEQLKEALDFLIHLFPAHNIGFRCVYPTASGGFFETLCKLGFLPITSRRVFLFDATSDHSYKARLFKSDLKLLEGSGYERMGPEDFCAADAPRVAQLYRFLNVDKHSALNPHYSEQFAALALEKGLLRFIGLRKEGRIDAIAGIYELNGVMTCPFLGYDTSYPQEAGLYRQIHCLQTLEAKKRNILFHQSASAGQFKELRRAKREWEYTMVYQRHLALPRRLPWLLLGAATKHIGQRVMQSLDL